MLTRTKRTTKVPKEAKEDLPQRTKRRRRRRLEEKLPPLRKKNLLPLRRAKVEEDRWLRSGLWSKLKRRLLRSKREGRKKSD
jgi:hypothetical protein